MTGPHSKVVPLRPGSGGQGRDGGAMDSSPAALTRLQERFRTLYQQLVQTMFDHVDDALFELADKSADNGEQNMFFESMREVRIKRRGIEQALARDLQEAFRCLISGLEVGKSADSEAVDSSSLALVDHDELEEIVAVDGMIAKAEKDYGQALVALNARIETLVPGPVTLKSNPIGPASLCNSFFAATHQLDLDIKAKLVLFKLFDRHVITGLGAVYSAGNALLVESGVLPRMRSRGRADAAAGGSNFSEQAEAQAEEVFHSLQQLLGHARPQYAHLQTEQRSGLLAPGLAPALPRDALMKLLAAIQQHQINWLAQQEAAILRGVAPHQFDVLQVLNQLLLKKLPEHAVSIGQVDDDTINLVSMLFQFIIEDRNLAAPIKGLLARLQIPILKVAMLDKTFFGKGGHPARKLLNEVANASLGWSPAGAAERDPFYKKVLSLVDRITSEFVDDIGLFQEVLTDFLAFVEMDRRRASLVEQRTIDAEDGRAKSELARATVQAALDEKIAGQTLPGAVAKLLNDGWSNVLFLICLKEGTDSESWQLGLRTVDDLLESVSPVVSLVDRARLLRVLPTLLKNLRSGLSKIGFNPFEMNQLFADLEQIHLQRLKREETAGLVARSEPVEAQSEFAQMRAESTARAVEPQAQPAPVINEANAFLAAPLEAPMPAAETRTLDEVLDSREQMQAIEGLERELSAQFGDLEVGDLEDLDSGDEVAGAAEAAAAPDTAVPELVAAAAPPAEAASARADRVALEHIDRLQVGGWVELQQEGRVVRCRLAAVIRATGKFVFVNRAGVKVAENNREGLAHAYRSGMLTILDEGRLFDRALESVIGNLREMKSRPPV